VNAVAHALTAAEGHAICMVLHAVEHIDVTVDVVGCTAHVHPLGPVSTGQEVTALRAFAAVTDSVVWDPVAPR
jgi:hypothetical protein